MWPIRVALSNKAFTPGGAVEIAHILGKEETSLRRIRVAIEDLKKSVAESAGIKTRGSFEPLLVYFLIVCKCTD